MTDHPIRATFELDENAARHLREALRHVDSLMGHPPEYADTLVAEINSRCRNWYYQIWRNGYDWKWKIEVHPRP